MLTAGQHDAPDGNHIHIADRFADYRKGIVADFPVGNEIVRTDEITRIDAGLWDKLVNINCPVRFQRNVFQLVLRYLDVGVGIDLVRALCVPKT